MTRLDAEGVAHIGRPLLVLAIGLAFLSLSPAAKAVPVVGAPVIVAADGPVIATYRGNSAAFSNDLYLAEPVGAYPGLIFNNHASPIGSMVNLGDFTAGTELVFRLHVNDTGYDYYTGLAARNPDGLPHARVDADYSDTETLVDFEDLFGLPEFPGGYNDLSFSFTNVMIPEPCSLVLMLCGISGLVGFGSRRRP
jgi:hypothetical protein